MIDAVLTTAAHLAERNSTLPAGLQVPDSANTVTSPTCSHGDYINSDPRPTSTPEVTVTACARPRFNLGSAIVRSGGRASFSYANPPAAQ
jgi:hypothetical protein